MRKFNIYYRATDSHQPQQNPNEHRMKVYNKGKNSILEQTDAPIYLWLHVILILVVISNYLNEPSHGNHSAHKIFTETYPDTSHSMHYKLWDHV